MSRISRRFIDVSGIALLFCSIVSAQTSNRAQLIKEVENLHEQIGEREKQLLLPDRTDQEKYAEFLGELKGIIRLLPREKYDSNRLFNERSVQCLV
ncbi:MAG: hypothetical protein NVSMB56_20150 [Pyrinomonadaceae bacterium]